MAKARRKRVTVDLELDDILYGSDNDKHVNLSSPDRQTYVYGIQDRISDVFGFVPPKKSPRVYRPEFGQILIDLASNEGCPFTAALSEIGISRATAERWLEKYPDFAEAKAKAEMAAIRFWHKVGVLGCLGKIEGFKPDVWKLYMKNLARFSDRVDVTADVRNLVVTAEIGNDGTIERRELTDSEALAMLNEAMQYSDGSDGAIDE